MIRDDILVRYLEALEHGANLDEVTRGNPAAREELAGFIELKQQLLDLPKNITLPATTKSRLRAQLLAEIRQPAVNNTYDFAEWWGRLVDEARNAVRPCGAHALPAHGRRGRRGAGLRRDGRGHRLRLFGNYPR